MAKVNEVMIGDIICQTCKDRFDEIVPRQKTAVREKERNSFSWCKSVDNFVKTWKATHAEKEGLKALWEEVRK